MKLPFFSLFITSPFEGLLEHAEKVKECAWAFQQALECHVSAECQSFAEYKQEVDNLENEADAIKRRIRGHLPKGTRLPVSKFELFLYLKEQDNVLDSVQDALDWLSFRMTPGIPPDLHKLFFLLVDAVIDPLEELSRMVAEAKKYFETYSDKQRNVVKGIIANLRQREHEVDQIEDELMFTIFSTEKDPICVFHLVKLVEIIGSVADHAENAGDMMRAMIAKRRGFMFRVK